MTETEVIVDFQGAVSMRTTLVSQIFLTFNSYNFVVQTMKVC